MLIVRDSLSVYNVNLWTASFTEEFSIQINLKLLEICFVNLKYIVYPYTFVATVFYISLYNYIYRVYNTISTPLVAFQSGTGRKLWC